MSGGYRETSIGGNPPISKASDREKLGKGELLIHERLLMTLIHHWGGASQSVRKGRLLQGKSHKKKNSNYLPGLVAPKLHSQKFKCNL